MFNSVGLFSFLKCVLQSLLCNLDIIHMFLFKQQDISVFFNTYEVSTFEYGSHKKTTTSESIVKNNFTGFCKSSNKIPSKFNRFLGWVPHCSFAFGSFKINNI